MLSHQLASLHLDDLLQLGHHGFVHQRLFPVFLQRFLIFSRCFRILLSSLCTLVILVCSSSCDNTEYGTLLLRFVLFAVSQSHLQVGTSHSKASPEAKALYGLAITRNSEQLLAVQICFLLGIYSERVHTSSCIHLAINVVITPKTYEICFGIATCIASLSGI